MSGLTVLRASDYTVTPWKNGGGITQDVLLLPKGATQDDFDIRVSLAPIVVAGAFSSFPGIDRHITLLTRERLELVFGADTVALSRLEPLHFDSVQQPVSRLPDGAVRVLNVMTRRGRWTAQVMPARGDKEPLLAVPEGGLAVLHAVTGTWQVSDRLGAALVHPGETLVAGDGGTLRASCEPTGEAIVAFLAPARPR